MNRMQLFKYKVLDTSKLSTLSILKIFIIGLKK